MRIDLTAREVREKARAIEQSLEPDRPAAWPPAFAASDAKSKPPQTQLRQRMDESATLLARTGSAPAPESADPSEAQPERTGTFLAFVRSWLGRA